MRTEILGDFRIFVNVYFYGCIYKEKGMGDAPIPFVSLLLKYT